MVSVHADLKNTHQKLNKALYLDAHILDIYVTLEDLLEVGHLHIVFTLHLSFHKLLTDIFMIDLNMSQCPAVHDLANSKEVSDVLSCVTLKTIRMNMKSTLHFWMNTFSWQF